MNLVKSIFILLAPAWMSYVALMAIMGLLNQFNIYLYFGVLLSAFPLLLFLLYILIFRNIARTHVHLMPVSVPSLMGYVMVLVGFIYQSDPNLLPLIMYSMSCFLLTLLYIYWYSNNARALSKSIIINQALPQFNLEDLNQKTINSKQFVGRPCLILFFRGNWCPLCMAQINEIVNDYKKFEEKGIDVIFISPQASDKTKKLAEKFELSIKFYSDKDNKAAQELGINHPFGLPMGFQSFGYETHTVYPTIIATNKQGQITYHDQTSNYRVRPEPKDMLELFD